MNLPLVSIIVPIYQVEKYLDECVLSILNQTYKNLEIILVNDGSSDGSKDICEKYKELDNRVKVIHKQNGGLVSARKAGLLCALGDYIGYVDGDDWIESSMYEELVLCAEKHLVDIVVSGHKEEISGEISEVLFNTIDEGYYSKERLIRDVYPKMINTGYFSQFGIFSYSWNKLFKRDLILETQLIVDDKIFMAEDAACTYPSLLKSKSIYILKSAKYHYRQRIDSMVKTRDESYLHLEKYNHLYNHLKIEFLKFENSDLLMGQLDAFVLSLMTVRIDMKEKLNLSESEIYPFGEIGYGSKLIIFGAGTFGQHLMNRIHASNKYELTGWIDNQYAGNNIFNFNISKIDNIKMMNFDFILVAYINEVVANENIELLINLGVKKEKIKRTWIYDVLDTKSLIAKMGIEVN